MHTRKIFAQTIVSLSIVLGTLSFDHPAQAGFKTPKMRWNTRAVAETVSNVYTLYTLYNNVRLATGQVVRTCQDVKSNGTRSNPYRC
jgi:hypothetical protein